MENIKYGNNIYGGLDCAGPAEGDVYKPAYALSENWEIVSKLLNNFVNTMPNTASAGAARAQVKTAEMWVRQVVSEVFEEASKVQQFKDEQHKAGYAAQERNQHQDILGAAHRIEQALANLAVALGDAVKPPEPTYVATDQSATSGVGTA
jgi:hypothetical protein